MIYFPRTHGFTLIETVIVVALSVSMMTALSLLIYNFNKIVAYGNTFLQSSGSASAVMRDIETLVLPSNAVLSLHTFSSATYYSSANELVLEIPSIDSSGIVIDNTFDYAVFYISGTNVYRLLEANALSSRTSGTKQLSSTVNSLEFTFNDSNFSNVNIVTIDIRTQAYSKQDVLTDHRHEQIRLRNY